MNTIDSCLHKALFWLRLASGESKNNETKDYYAEVEIERIILDVKLVLDREPVTKNDNVTTEIQEALNLNNDQTKTYEQIEADRVVWINSLKEG